MSELALLRLKDSVLTSSRQSHQIQSQLMQGITCALKIMLWFSPEQFTENGRMR
jgi:hypothetical protein